MFVLNPGAGSPTLIVASIAPAFASEGTWVVNGYGIAPADRNSTQPDTESTAKCWLVLDMQLCD